jgi:hypothetical protein
MRLFNFSLLLFCTVISYGLELNGIVVTRKDDTLQTIISVKEAYLQNYLVSTDLVSKLKYIDKKELLKKISPKKIKLISFQWHNEAFKFYSIEIAKNDLEEGTTSTQKFYRLVNNPNSRVILYEFYDASHAKGSSIGNSMPTNKPIYKNYLVGVNKNYTVVSAASFKNDVKPLFNDDPELLEKIKTGIYTFADMSLIVEAYNNGYVAKKKN